MQEQDPWFLPLAEAKRIHLASPNARTGAADWRRPERDRVPQLSH